jgi:hypothetical protein
MVADANHLALIRASATRFGVGARFRRESRKKNFAQRKSSPRDAAARVDAWKFSCRVFILRARACVMMTQKPLCHAGFCVIARIAQHEPSLAALKSFARQIASALFEQRATRTSSALIFC